MLTMGASAEKYMYVAPESTMPVACMEVEFILLFVMVGLYPAVLINVYLDSIKLLFLLTVPHTHTQLHARSEERRVVE